MKKIDKNLLVAVSAFLGGSSIAANLSGLDLIESRSGVVASTTQSNMLQLNRAINGTAVFSEDFQGMGIPAGWVLVDVDGLSPVNQDFTDAWIVREDTDVEAGLWAAASTSWYNPVGQADDWMITPSIPISDVAILSWVARSFEPNYRDGYEVYVSTTTQDVAGCTVDAPIFTIAEEEIVYTSREVDLALAGYSNTEVFICFRNNSNDKNILQIDDITVTEILAQNDVVLDAVAAVPEYTKVPDKLLGYDIPLSVDFSNRGLSDQSNITVEAEIFLDATPLTTVSQVYAGPLVSRGSDSLDLGHFTATSVGVYDVVYTLILDSVADENPADNTATVINVTEITTDTMSRDDGEVNTGTLGIGAGDGGYLGNMYEFSTEVTVSSIEFIHDNNDCDVGGTEECGLDGETINVDVFAINQNTGLPEQMVGTSEDYVVPVGFATDSVVELNFPGGLNLSPGQYVFALAEPVRTVSTYGDGGVSLHTTENRFTAGTAWVDWPSNPNGTWSNNEDFEFFNTYYMRPKFIETDLIFKNGFE